MPTSSSAAFSSTSCPTDFTASVTTASSPMATGPTTLHWLAGCSAHQTQLAGALTPIAPTVVMNTKSGIFVLAAAAAWSSSRPSDPAASRDCGPFQQSPSIAHDQHAPCRHPTLPRQFHADVSSAMPALRQSQLSVPPSTAKTEIAHDKTTVPILHAATKANATMITRL